MAKMTRSKLKGVIKECIFELLSEAFTPDEPVISETKKRNRRQRVIAAEEARLAEHRQKFETRVTNTAAAVTDDPILRDILADTARTTLQEQIANPDQRGTSSGLQGLAAVDSSAGGINLDSIFADSKQDWASLAFPKKKIE